MEKHILILFVLLSVIGYTQNGINYKALIKDASGNVIANTTVQIQFTIIQDVTDVYTETHSPTTDANGIIIVNIGEGTATSGGFNTINWAEENHSLNVQVDTGAGLVDLGTTQFMSVPYAKHAESATNASNVSGLEALDEGNGIGWRLIDRNPDNYGDIGLNAVDLSYNLTISTVRGATGFHSTAMGFNTTASGSYSTAIGGNTIASEFYSTAMGFNTTASGISSMALGHSNEATGNYSTTMGSQTTATGDYSTAMGSQTTAAGDYSTTMGRNTMAAPYSTAMGYNTTASGFYSTAIGRNTMASEDYSTAMGWSTEASGPRSTAMGFETTAIGNTSTTMGFSTTASGQGSTAMGWNTEATGDYSTTMGLNTIASGDASFAMGLNNVASGDYSTTIGIATTAPAYAETVIGVYNTTYTPNASSEWNSSDRLFVIGNGGDFISRSNAMVILKNGNTGIGTDNPQELLHISGGRLRIGSETIEDTGSNQLSVDASLIPNTNNTFRLGNASNRWIGVWAINGTINTSDRREKENIENLNYGLAEILQMQPVSFKWKNRNNQDTKLGLIAQDVLKIVPEVVKTHIWEKDEVSGVLTKKELDRLGLYYSDLIPVLIKAIQEQQEIIGSQNTKIEGLTAEVTTLRSMNTRIKALEQQLKTAEQ